MEICSSWWLMKNLLSLNAHQLRIAFQVSTARNKKMCVKRCVVYVRMPHSKLTMLPKEIFHFARSTLLPVHPCSTEHKIMAMSRSLITLFYCVKNWAFSGKVRKRRVLWHLHRRPKWTWREQRFCHHSRTPKSADALKISEECYQSWEDDGEKLKWCLVCEITTLYCERVALWLERIWTGDGTTSYSCHCLCGFSTVCLVLSTAVKWWQFKFWTRSKEKTPSCMHYKYML